MDKQKTISIRMNGKETIVANEKKQPWDDAYKEHAATLDQHYEPDDLLEFEKKDTSDSENWFSGKKKKKHKNRNNSQRFSIIKTFMVAGVSAVLIGLTLGFILLRLFVGIGEEGDQTANSSQANQNPTSAAGNDDRDDTETNNQAAGDEEDNPQSEESAGNSVSYTLEHIQAVVIQAGVFSTLDKAETWQQQFTDASFPTMVWEHDGQFRLFAGLFVNEQTADMVAEQMTASGLEPYVRPWQTEATALEMSTDAAAWMDAFPEMWQQTIGELDNAGSLEADWQAWLDQYPDSSEQLAGVQQSAEQFTEALTSGEDVKQLQIYLLELWEQYTQLVQAG